METEKRTILYTIGCPNCKVLERRLEAKKIPYDTVTDLEIMKQKASERFEKRIEHEVMRLIGALP